MTVSEFMFLAIGLGLGVASGAALIAVIRARPSAHREIRLTVAQDAIPRRRATTLADDGFVTISPEPARGGPADRRGLDGPVPVGATDRRTNVLAGNGRMAPATIDVGNRVPGRLVGVPISAGSDPILGALRTGARDGSAFSPTAEVPPIRAASSSAIVDAARDTGATGRTMALDNASAPVTLLDPPAVGGPGATLPTLGPCADERRVADERCELASRAKAHGVAAAEALQRAQRAYDTHTSASIAAAEGIDPRAMRSLKEDAQRVFRAASRASTSTHDAEAAARIWLQEINRINREAAAASLAARRERETAAAVGATLERLSNEADGARVRAEMAAAACMAARTAVAECDELTAAGSSPPRATPPPPTEPVLSGMGSDEALGVALEGGTTPRIFRLLRGDPDAMAALVASLAGDDPDELRRWKLAVTGLLDAILADAIEQSVLRFPHDHLFWGPYNQQQQRDITRALASLGHRFDGLGGWVDERLPSQRELSLAVGYAGLDPMRVRQWPSEQQTAELFREVEVAADEYLAAAAGDLTLAEMVETLGQRADGLVELWNHWGRIRPLLLEEA